MNDEKVKEIIEKITKDNWNLRDELFGLSTQEQEEAQNAIKVYIENNEQELNSRDKERLIKATGDSAYMKACVKNDKLGLEPYRKARIIEATEDKEYIKDCVADNNSGISLWDKMNLIEATKDVDYIKDCVSNNNLGLDLWAKIRLIDATKDKDYIKDCIANNNLGLDSRGKVGLIEQIKDVEYKKECVNNDKIGLDPEDKIVLIRAISDKGFTKECVKNEGIGLFSWDKVGLIKSIQDVEYIKECVLNGDLGLDSKNKADLIKSTHSEDYTKECVKNDKIGLNSEDKVRLIAMIKDAKYKKECVNNDKIRLDPEDKVVLIREIRDIGFTKECVKNEGIGLNSNNKAALIAGTQDIEYIKECLTDFKMNFYAQKMLVEESKDEELIKKYKEGVRTVRNISELSCEDLERDNSCVGVKIVDEEHGIANKVNNEYTRQEYLAIRKVADKVLKRVKIPEKGDAGSELAAFLEISRRLANHMKYDYLAISPEGEKNSVLQKTCRNLHGGLLEGKCVCAGYAEILRNISSCVGIEVKYIRGTNSHERSGHAWNQVKIGNAWFNIDLTNERDRIMENGEVSRTVLKTTMEFNKDCGEFSEERSQIEEECNVNINDLVSAKVGLDSPIGRIVMKGAKGLGVLIYELRKCLSILKDLGKDKGQLVER